MTSVLSTITLAVHDVDRSVRFYETVLGHPPDATAGFPRFRCGTVWVALLTREDFALVSGNAGAGLPQGAGSPRGAGPAQGAAPPPASAFSLNVGGDDEVDRGMSAALAVGGVLTQPAESTSWGGYAGWVRDPDGHCFEIVFNPKHPGEPADTR